MKKILFVLPVVEDELEILQQNLAYHMDLFSKYNLDFSFFIIIQAKNVEIHWKLIDLLSNHYVIIKCTNVFSLSVSRNFGIDYFRENSQYSHLSFIDVRTCWDAMMVQECIKLMDTELLLWTGKIGWEKNKKISFQYNKNGLLTKCVTGFVWSMVFSRNSCIPYFNINACLSNNLLQELQAGEDNLFCYTLLRRLNESRLYSCNGTVIHPSRVGEGKRIKYAKAQGAVFRYLLPRLFKMDIWYGFYMSYRFMLFVANSVVGLFLFRAGAWNVFNNRFKGFCLYRYQKLINQGFLSK